MSDLERSFQRCQTGQGVPARIDCLLRALAYIQVQVLPAAWTKPFAIEAAQRTSGQGEQHLLTHDILKQQTASAIIPYLGLIFRNCALAGVSVRAFRAKQQVELPFQRDRDRFYAARAQDLKRSPVLGPHADVVHLLFRPAMFDQQIGLAVHGQRPYLPCVQGVVDRARQNFFSEDKRLFLQIKRSNQHLLSLRPRTPQVNASIDCAATGVYDGRLTYFAKLRREAGRRAIAQPQTGVQAPMHSGWRSSWFLVLAGFLLGALGVLYAQKAYREYPSVEGYETEPMPPDWQRKGEWTFARLMYPPGPLDGYAGRFDGDWHEGLSLWTQDGPKADRMLAAAVHRLSRVDARSVEQDVSLDDGDEIYNWPWLYAVQVGEWGLTDAECAKLRDYLLRGGFFMADDFHGHEEQAFFEATMHKVFPERPIVDIPNGDAIFHTVFDLDERFQVPGAEHLRTGYKKDGRVARWEGIYDDKGRILVAISLNSDLGDSWEWADTPSYPLKYSQMGLKLGVNYVVYAMTH